jgi:hypothetical protein
MNHRRPALWAGSLFALGMGVFFIFQQLLDGLPPLRAVGVGLASGLASGVVFAGLLVAFLRLPRVRAQIELQDGDLLPGERVLDSRLANLVVKPDDFGLDSFAFGDLLFLAGLRHREIIGGALHTTTLRLLFKAHRLNRLHGKVSVFLPSITALQPTSRWPFRRLGVATRLSRMEFVLSERDAVLARIEQARRDYGPAEEALLAPARSALPGIEGLAPDRALNALNTVINRSRRAGDAAELALTPLAALGGLLASELFDRGLAERWSKAMRRE